MDERMIWSIGFVLVVMVLCIVKPNMGRFFLGIFYLMMAIGINVVNAFTNPQLTVQMGEASLLGFYRTLFSEIVAKAPVVFILLIAIYQIVMALFILNKHKRVKLGLIGATVFLILITPFGYIQIPWLGMAAVQLYLVGKDFDKTFIETIVKSIRKDRNLKNYAS